MQGKSFTQKLGRGKSALLARAMMGRKREEPGGGGVGAEGMCVVLSPDSGLMFQTWRVRGK